MATDGFFQKGYWDHRYRKRKNGFDWFLSAKDSVSVILNYVKDPGSSRALDLGCGNSGLPHELLDAGVGSVVGIDFSGVVVEQMQSGVKEGSGLEFYEMDATQLDFPGRSFDLVVDKGLMDALMTADNGYALTAQLCESVHSVLAQGGLYIQFSFDPPEERLRFIRSKAIGLVPLVEGRQLSRGGVLEAASPASGGRECAPGALPSSACYLYVYRLRD